MTSCGHLDDQRVGNAPVVEWLDWTGRSLPTGWRLRRLKARLGNTPALGGRRRAETYRVARHRKQDADWQDSGFVMAARVPPRAEDRSAQAWTYLEWQGLSRELERQMTG